MAKFTPRNGKNDYIKPRGDHYYYRRNIPESFRQFFDGKTEWNIKLSGTSDAARRAESLTIAHKHNGMLVPDMDTVATIEFNPDHTQNLRLDFSPENQPVDVRIPPFEFYRAGRLIKTYKIAASNDPDFLRVAANDGFFVMTGHEMKEQVNLHRLRKDIRTAPNRDAKELAKLRSANKRRDIDEMAPMRGDTLRSILPKMHEITKPREATKAGHYKAVYEFDQLHGPLPVASITRAQVDQYVSHLTGLLIKGKSMAPTTVRQRLDRITAILQFAARIDAVEYNVAKAVVAPSDDRPRGDQSYKAFEKHEVIKLVEIATDVWTKRNYQNHITKMSRKTDFITALHMLTWTGARPEEICQLRLTDVDLDRKGILITNVSDDLDVRKRLTKNEDSVRAAPIHDRLLPIIGEHIDNIRMVSNSGLLFPSFEPQSDNGRYARPISAEWTQLLRHHITDDPQKVLYSLRHTWAVESMRVGMTETLRNSIMGHASDSSSSSARRYVEDFKDIDNKLLWINRMNMLN